MRIFRIFTSEGMVHPEVRADHFTIDENSVVRFWKRPNSRGEAEICLAALVAGYDTLVVDTLRIADEEIRQ